MPGASWRPWTRLRRPGCRIGAAGGRHPAAPAAVSSMSAAALPWRGSVQRDHRPWPSPRLRYLQLPQDLSEHPWLGTGNHRAVRREPDPKVPGALRLIVPLSIRGNTADIVGCEAAAEDEPPPHPRGQPPRSTADADLGHPGTRRPLRRPSNGRSCSATSAASTFSFFLICTIVGVDTIATVAQGGGQAFHLDDGLRGGVLVSQALLFAELGSAFPEEGGPDHWYRLAFGHLARAAADLPVLDHQPGVDRGPARRSPGIRPPSRCSSTTARTCPRRCGSSSPSRSLVVHPAAIMLFSKASGRRPSRLAGFIALGVFHPLGHRLCVEARRARPGREQLPPVTRADWCCWSASCCSTSSASSCPAAPGRR